MELRIERRKVEDLIPAIYNPRRALKPGDPEFEKLRRSIEEFGYVDPVIWNERTGMIVGGHQRLSVLRELGVTEVDVSVVDMDENREKALNVALNKIEGGWDAPLLRDLLLEIEQTGLDLELTGFESNELDELIKELQDDVEPDPDYEENVTVPLTERFGVPPFSVLDTRQGYWQDRKKAWLDIGLNSSAGRNERLLLESDTMAHPSFYPSKNKKEKELRRKLTTEEFLAVYWDDIKKELEGRSRIAGGTSIFDPVIAELFYRWFTPYEKAHILDPFTGGSVRGVVASKLGFDYSGIDLRQEQIDENRAQAAEIVPDKMPNWYVGDSNVVLDSIEKKDFDLIFSCPPYADLEVYSDDPADLSNMDYPDFMLIYESIIKKSVEHLADNRFAVFVISEVRGKDGNYYGFVPDTIAAFEKAGMKFYNEFILLNAVGTTAIRVGKQFTTGRKNGRVHQNILVFYKGNSRNIKEHFPNIEFSFEEFEESLGESIGEISDLP